MSPDLRDDRKRKIARMVAVRTMEQSKDDSVTTQRTGQRALVRTNIWAPCLHIFLPTPVFYVCVLMVNRNGVKLRAKFSIRVGQMSVVYRFDIRALFNVKLSLFDKSDTRHFV